MQRHRTGMAIATAMLLVCAAPMQAANKKTIVVASDGSGQFKTVQEAVDFAPAGNVLVKIKPGEYRQVLSISANGVELRGLGKRPEDVVLVYDNSAAAAGGTGKSASVTVTGDDFYAENLTIANDFEKRLERKSQGSQAVALRVTGDREVFRHVRLLGYQDTLYATHLEKPGRAVRLVSILRTATSKATSTSSSEMPRPSLTGARSTPCHM